MNFPRFTTVLLLGAFAVASWQRNPPAEAVVEDPTNETTALEGIAKLEGMVTFNLEDGEVRNRENPDNFWIPTRARRDNLAEDELVKLIFNLSDGKQTQVERMWVIIKSRDGSRYNGILDNDPYCTDQIKAGLEVSFEPRHVIDIYEGVITETNHSEQGDAGQPSTRSESDSEGNDNPQPESEMRSR
jgi:Uncharacterized protein conserved in bacteria (DUF2314)